ncbi:MAG: hypothetical protein ABI797_08085 [Chloroflexota bacterium]
MVAALAPPDMTATYLLLMGTFIGVLALVSLVVWGARRFWR